MNKKIFRSSVAVALVVLLSSIVLIMGILFQYFENQLQSELESEANYIAYAVENQGLDYIENFTDSDKRITLISPDGDVIADTSADESKLDDHSDRQEVADAMKNGQGTSIRYSGTLAEKTVYYAMKMNDGNILRVSTTQYTVVTILISLLQPILIVFVVAIAVSFIMAQRISKSIKQMNLLTYNRAALKLLDIDKITSEKMLTDCDDNLLFAIEKALTGEREKSDLTFNNSHYRLIANPVLEENIVIGAVIIIMDVTESVQREQLRQEFTSNVSHELKTPLTSISGFAEMMKSGDTPDSVVKDFSSSIYEEAQRLITLVNDIIKISELDEKKDKADMEEVDLFELSSDIISRLEPVAVKRNICLNLIGESTVLLGNEKILDEMIYNLCDNAIKYNADNGTVDVILNESSKHIKLTVRDTGIGIPQSEQERIFERFYRVDKSHSKTIGGTGLGLSIVKHAAIYHNAEIKVKSELDKGTSITVMFNK
ncbi:MAG: histidine kinase [Eubacterium sp.]|nr:histidine kinase [Eubacterium sp.]